MNRSSDAATKHQQSGPRRGLSSLDPSRVEFHKADLSRRHLGLASSVYRRLIHTVTHVIRKYLCIIIIEGPGSIENLDNQWTVNFNWILPSFEPYIRGVRRIIDFCLASTQNAQITYISSVSAVGSWPGVGQVPEKVFPEPNVASDIGYGQSKLVAEVLLDDAAQISGLRSACCRVGIIAGPVRQRLGLWNKYEYIPSVSAHFFPMGQHVTYSYSQIILSSARLGVFPVNFPSRDRVDWIPVDEFALASLISWLFDATRL